MTKNNRQYKENESKRRLGTEEPVFIECPLHGHAVFAHCTLPHIARLKDMWLIKQS